VRIETEAEAAEIREPRWERATLHDQFTSWESIGSRLGSIIAGALIGAQRLDRRVAAHGPGIHRAKSGQPPSHEEGDSRPLPEET
jgi:hypothetical protein